MELQGWPQILPDRFEGEDLRSYKDRSTRIREIMTGFRMGRYRGQEADRRERELIQLQEVGFERLRA